MSDAYIGQIAPFAFNYTPQNWAACDGQQLTINQFPALYSLLGTTYGGNGMTTFALPDLRGRAPIHIGNGIGGSSFTVGQVGGEASVRLVTNQLPIHNHQLLADNKAAAAQNANVPSDALVLGNSDQFDGKSSSTLNLYYNGSTTNVATALGAAAGAGQPHENRQPFTVLNFCICTNGAFPSRSGNSG